MTDGDLIRLVREGSVSACETLVRRYVPQLMAICRARIRSLHTAEDLAQESLLKALNSLDSLTDGDRFGPWIRSIAINLCRDAQRSQRHRVWHGVSTESQGTPLNEIAVDLGLPDRELERQEDRTQLWNAIDALPDECREVVLLRYFDECGYDQMSARLDVSRATVNARLAKGRELLRRRLAAHQEQSHELR